jgi:hypothetical protein
MAHGKAIQGLAVESPGWHEVVHEGDEAGVVCGFKKVDHFMRDDVFEAFARFAGEIGVEADAGGGGAATAPFGFHRRRAIHSCN